MYHTAPACYLARPVSADHGATRSPAADFVGKFPEGSVELWQL